MASRKCPFNDLIVPFHRSLIHEIQMIVYRKWHLTVRRKVFVKNGIEFTRNQDADYEIRIIINL